MLELTVKITENQEKLFKAAITMTEAGVGSFDECVEALKQFKGDAEAALQFLLDKIEAEQNGNTKQWKWFSHKELKTQQENYLLSYWVYFMELAGITFKKTSWISYY